jgi:hypothetical protein
MPSDRVLKINGEEYEAVPEIASITSKWLVEIWERLGKPDTPLSDAGGRMMDVIIAVWEELYPKEAKKWTEDRKDYKKAELDIKEQIRKHTGRNLASYPYPIFAMMSKLFPHFKPGDRQNCMKLVAKWPMFKFANKA